MATIEDFKKAKEYLTDLKNNNTIVAENLGYLSALEDFENLILGEVNSTLQVLEFEEQLTKITKEIHMLEDSYINADECGNISDKIYIGKELKRLRKELENL